MYLPFLVSISVVTVLGAFAAEQENDNSADQVLVLEGQVTDAHGGGQSGVSVTVHARNADGSKGDVIASAVTDEMGDFAIHASQRPRCEIMVSFSKPNYADLVRILTLSDDEVPFLGEALSGNLTLSGKVTDVLEGRPIAGARVTLDFGPDRQRAATGEDGQFVLTGLAPGPAELIIEADGYGREKTDIPKVEAESSRDVNLKPERIVHVKVMDESSKPVPDVVVELLDQARTDLRQDITDASGQVTFAGIHFDAYTLAVRLTHREFVSSASFDRQIAPPRTERESTHQFTITRAGGITGRITSAKDSQPVQGARVLVGEQYSDQAPRDYTDPDGRYTVHGVRPGLATVTAHLSGYAPELKTVEVKAGESSTLDLVLEPPQTIEGIVTSDKGQPLSDVEIVATAWRGKGTLGLRAMSNKEGRFRIDNAPADSFEVMATGPNRQTITLPIQAKPGETVAIKLPTEGVKPKDKGLLQVGDDAPAITLRPLSGEPINLTELKGKTVLVDFWATWCLPCVQELRHFLAIQERYGARKDFMIIAISRDHDVEVVREHLQRHPQVVWPQIVGPASGVPQAVESFGVSALPEVFLIGPDGKVIANKLRGERIEQAVDEAMKGHTGG